MQLINETSIREYRPLCWFSDFQYFIK